MCEPTFAVTAHSFNLTLGEGDSDSNNFGQPEAQGSQMLDQSGPVTRSGLGKCQCRLKPETLRDSLAAPRFENHVQASILDLMPFVPDTKFMRKTLKWEDSSDVLKHCKIWQACINERHTGQSMGTSQSYNPHIRRSRQAKHNE